MAHDRQDSGEARPPAPAQAKAELHAARKAPADANRGTNGTVRNISFGYDTEAHRIMAVLAAMETGGRHLGRIAYNAKGPTITNPNSEHYGAQARGGYGVMPKYIKSWAEEAGHPGINDETFTPAIQDATMEHRILVKLQRGEKAEQIIGEHIGHAKTDGYMTRNDYIKEAMKLYKVATHRGELENRKHLVAQQEPSGPTVVAEKINAKPHTQWALEQRFDRIKDGALPAPTQIDTLGHIKVGTLPEKFEPVA